MKKCLICGSEFTDEKLFCPDCGAKLEEVSGNRTTDQGAVSGKGSVAGSGDASEKKSMTGSGAASEKGPVAAQGTVSEKGPVAAQEAVSGKGPVADQGAAYVEKPVTGQGNASVEKDVTGQGGASAQGSAPKQEPVPERMPASAQESISGQKSPRIPGPEVDPKPYQAPGAIAKSSSSGILPIVILSVLAFVSFITAVVFFFQINDYSRRLDNARQAENNMRRESEQAKSELEQVKSELAECQSALEQAQINQAVSEVEWAAMLEAERGRFDGLQELYGYGSENYYAEQSVVVLQKGESKEITVFYDLSGTVSMSAGSGISYEWSREWLQHKTQVIVTGNSTGYYPLKFTNKQNSDSFEVLVIVTDKE